MQIQKNFWHENRDNVTYSAIYMVFDAISRLKPQSVFNLPVIEKLLKEASTNETTYPLWGSGKGKHMYFC